MGIHDGHREKMRRRYMESGLEGFADHEALELLLFYAIPRRDTNPIAHALINRYESLSNVLNAPVEELASVEGIGENAAVLIRLVSQLNQKAGLPSGKKPVVIRSTVEAGNYLVRRFAGERGETAFELCLDRKGKLLSCKRLGQGGDLSVNFDIRQLVANALLFSASSVILAHNHPSGEAAPSHSDYAATERVRAALRAVDIELADHIIVADSDYVSMRDSGCIR
ncbi:MAG: DNA repair protein RadC [Oscillibacter sp.]|nr:DNA repair protein RadC [Oscillibacter sp.]